MKRLLAAAIAVGALAGCQTADQTGTTAGYACQSSGLQPGSRPYRDCVNTELNRNTRTVRMAGPAVVYGGGPVPMGGSVVVEDGGPYGYRNRGYYDDQGYVYGRRSYRRGYEQQPMCDGWRC